MRSFWCPLLLAISTGVLAAACGGGGSTSAPNPGATIRALSPTTVEWNSAAFTLTINGSGFSPDAVVQWNGSPRPTTYVSSEQ
jgi:hypothetical protein